MDRLSPEEAMKMVAELKSGLQQEARENPELAALLH